MSDQEAKAQALMSAKLLLILKEQREKNLSHADVLELMRRLLEEDYEKDSVICGTGNPDADYIGFTDLARSGRE
jgi:hypothetical protein